MRIWRLPSSNSGVMFFASLESSFLADCRKRRERAEHEVSRFVLRAKRDVFEQLKDDWRMPRSVNYIERYNAFMKMKDREDFFKRLDQTFKFADGIVSRADGVCPEKALNDAAKELGRQVKALDGVIVAPSDDGSRRAEKPKMGGSEESMRERERIVSQLKEMFDRALESADEGEAIRSFALETKEWSDRDKRALEEASFEVESAIEEIKRKRADSVAGTAFAVLDFASFSAEIACNRIGDIDKIQALSSEVEKSFLAFKEIVRDNGLFAAFSNEGSYGTCCGYRYNSWRDDAIYSEFTGANQTVADGISLCIEEGEGGDTIERSIERMREANGGPYDGFLMMVICFTLSPFGMATSS